MTDAAFEALVAEGLDCIPLHLQRLMNNVAVTVEPRARPEQNNEVAIRHGQQLLGLYEGVPLTRRGPGYGMVLPDKITIFKDAILNLATSEEAIRSLVADTVWHEVAHHFGLDDDEIARAEARRHAAD